MGSSAGNPSGSGLRFGPPSTPGAVRSSCGPVARLWIRSCARACRSWDHRNLWERWGFRSEANLGFVLLEPNEHEFRLRHTGLKHDLCGMQVVDRDRSTASIKIDDYVLQLRHAAGRPLEARKPSQFDGSHP